MSQAYNQIENGSRFLLFLFCRIKFASLGATEDIKTRGIGRLASYQSLQPFIRHRILEATGFTEFPARRI